MNTVNKKSRNSNVSKNPPIKKRNLFDKLICVLEIYWISCMENLREKIVKKNEYMDVVLNNG